MNNYTLEEYNVKIEDAKSKVESIIGDFKPRIMIICGSGLGGIVNILSNQKVVKYGDIGLKDSTVPGHDGKLVFGEIGANKVPVMCMVGRLHFYEGYSLQDTTLPIRLGKVIGIETVIVTNAAGGVNKDYRVGDLMLINDHINFVGFAGFNPLRGPNLGQFGPRFLGLSDAYDFDLRRLFFQTKQKLNIQRKVHEGVYFFTAGPTFESRAEVRMIKTLGGDAVGMSTVPEVIVARHCGIKVLALSLITNEGVGSEPPSALTDQDVKLDEGMANHAEVLEAANEASKDVQRIFEETINQL
ncbi:purine nucleoside phosphorylase [[Candida] jaroonii]|uniref:Purine nucleoside phosphorylase n=1 Tax=[Candida] jaroonii TaxID=467808 RepID=A0ACA9YAZ8_9ASCO|nr:purine nucleoside phosphorylase [[Candida] jaroonii]